MILWPYNIIFSLILIIIVFFLFYYLELKPSNFLKSIFSFILNLINKKNTKKSIKKLKKERIVKSKKNIYSKYNSLAETLIKDYNLALTLEGFNSLLILIFSIISILTLIFFSNLTLSILVSLSVLVGGFTYFLMKSRMAESLRIEAIMDAEDLLCPLAKDGVLVAIIKVIENKEYLHPSIRGYFIQFVDGIEHQGYSFKRAMEILNRQLGPKFDSFSEKAIVFEYNERTGMSDIFLDIVDENAATREINARKNIIFKQMNREFLIKTSLIGLFLLYSMTGSSFREFMLETDIGKFVNGIAIVTICLSFARCQTLQRELGIKFKNRGD